MFLALIFYEFEELIDNQDQDHLVNFRFSADNIKKYKSVNLM